MAILGVQRPKRPAPVATAGSSGGSALGAIGGVASLAGTVTGNPALAAAGAGLQFIDKQANPATAGSRGGGEGHFQQAQGVSSEGGSISRRLGQQQAAADGSNMQALKEGLVASIDLPDQQRKEAAPQILQALQAGIKNQNRGQG